ncbi:hypothetical protein NDK47_12995 [Brevibacillus ruminantium]|uniref:Uncharacterized protein n=1 Tax=Brevibacillus ruminantium TaxID=2950604 RepID=A0ABY4WM22_9BACL|nr:hypothetical protein [Brevibacillus ruminantium]USG68137.1 hypothetical protein NDK47_12995 [Brevibacillus ruminantium]
MGTIYLNRKERQKLLDIISNHLDQTIDIDKEEAEKFEPDRKLVLRLKEKCG